MQKLLSLMLVSLGGWLGWWLGARAGMMTAFVLSMIGVGLGLYAARLLARHYLN